jgi:hypothetical protein
MENEVSGELKKPTSHDSEKKNSGTYIRMSHSFHDVQIQRQPASAKRIP